MMGSDRRLSSAVERCWIVGSTSLKGSNPSIFGVARDDTRAWFAPRMDTGVQARTPSRRMVFDLNRSFWPRPTMWSFGGSKSQRNILGEVGRTPGPTDGYVLRRLVS